MKAKPTSAAWEEDSFWREVVAVLTGGKKLRGEHYLQGLSAESLDQLRLALSFAGTFEKQQALCPRRVGGATDGALPPIGLLSEISQAIRQVKVLRGLQRQDLIGAATKERCGELGLDPQLTNAVVRIVGEEALSQHAENQVGSFAISAATVMLMAESNRTRAKQEDQKISLREREVEVRSQQGAQKISLTERKLKLLEIKAAQLDQIKALRDPKAAMNDADRKAIVDKVDEILGLK